MSKHTPGPWRYEEFGPNVIIKATKNPMLSVVHSLYQESREQTEANAHLIAAAPELLEALENLLKVHEGEGGTQYHAGDMARAAIAKAKGERRVLPSPQEPDSFTVGAARAAIAKAKGE